MAYITDGILTGGMRGGSDITDALVSAFAGAAQTHRTVHLGDGDWGFSQPLTQDGFSVRGESENTHLYWTGDPALPGAVYTVSDHNTIDGRIPTLQGLTLTGPWRGGIGDPPPAILGVVAQCAARIDNLFAGNFAAGVTDDSYSGHLYLSACKLSNNVYGLYTRNRNGDTRIAYCDLTGNTLASCGMTPEGGLQNSSVIGTHLGFSPYAFYKESGQPADGIGTTFLGDVTILDSPAEAVGNAYAWSDYVYQPGGPRDEVRHLRIVGPGFTRNAGYRRQDRPLGTLHGDYLRGVIDITQGDNPITDPSGGTRLFEFALPFPSALVIDGTPLPATAYDNWRAFLPAPAQH